MRQVHRYILSFSEAARYRSKSTVTNGVFRDNFQECHVGQPKPLESVVTRGDRTGKDDFLAFLNDEPELVEEAGTLALMKYPPCLGRVVRAACLELLGLSVTEKAPRSSASNLDPAHSRKLKNLACRTASYSHAGVVGCRPRLFGKWPIGIFDRVLSAFTNSGGRCVNDCFGAFASSSFPLQSLLVSSRRGRLTARFFFMPLNSQVELWIQGV